jgi:DNA-binding GntR family transcriptional regulator
MHRESSAASGTQDARLERAIVLHMLSDDPGRRWPRARIEVEIQAAAPDVREALGRLVGAGVLCADERQVWVSPASSRLDELGLIAV